jgi:hypothetical protein
VRTRSLRLSVLVLCLGAPVALAAGLGDYEPIFPTNPCQDGWAACIVNGDAVTAEPTKDAAGRPQPSDLRVGWFDLEPTAALSPFVELSAYDGELDAPEPPAAPEAPVASGGGDERPVAVASNDDDGGGGGGQATQGGGRRDPGGETTAPSTGAGGTTSPSGRPMFTPTPVGQGSDLTAKTTPTNQPTGSGTAVAQLDNTAAVQPVAPPVANDSCDDLVALEPAALMGRMVPGQVKCLEGRLTSADLQTDKDKISRVLMQNAEAAGNKSEWERLIKRHLEDIDRSDPNLCFKYALHLSRGGVGRAWGVIKWADYALENKQQWTGSTYKARVNALYQLRAEAAVKLWEDANAKMLAAAGDDRSKLEADEVKLRGMAKDYSREWLDYARAAGEDIKKPMALCVSTAGSKKFCEE